MARAAPVRIPILDRNARQISGDCFVAQFNDYVIKDISLADYGRAEINIAETVMPGLMDTRVEYGEAQPLKGARIVGSLH